MKKIKLLGTLGLFFLFVGLSSNVQAEEKEYYGELGYRTKQFGYTNDFGIATELPILGIPTFFPNATNDASLQFGVFKIADLEKMDYFEAETSMNSIDMIQYAKNLTGVQIDGKVSDLRPLGNTKNLKELSINGPVTSLGFIKNLKKLEGISIDANSMDNNHSETNDDYKAITDISVLDELDKLEAIHLSSYDRPFPTVSLKKDITKYVLVNPFILSKQFENSLLEITSTTSGFTFENDILTWDNLTPETKELEISWKVKDSSKKFIFEGESKIPLYWK